MNRLKELRAGETQAGMAKRLGVTQQTYARWESGKSEPSIAKLRDLARIHETTVDHLLGRGPATPPSIRFNVIAENTDGFWGHLGLRLKGNSLSRWYPITEGQATNLQRRLCTGDYVRGWLITQTLNNRILAFRPNQMQRTRLIDDGSDEPEGDFESISTIDNELHSIETYKAMAEWADSKLGGDQLFAANNSKKFQDEVVAKLKRAGYLDRPTDLLRILQGTYVHSADGAQFRHDADRTVLADLLLDLEIGTDLGSIRIAECEDEFEDFYPPESVCLIEFPLIELEAAWEENADA